MRSRTRPAGRAILAALTLAGIGALFSPPLGAERRDSPRTPQARLAPAVQQRPVFRGDVELIQVEVVAVDAEGRPVRGLTPGDFTLLDEGEARDVAIFEEYARPAVDPARPVLPALPARFPRDVADNQATGADRLVVLAIDDMVPGDRYETIEALGRQVVEQFDDRAAMTLLFTSRAPRVEATTDRAELLRAIDRISERTAAAPRVARVVRNETGRCANDMLSQVADALRFDDHRRKLFIYISPYCPSPIDLNAASDVESIRASWETLERLRRANVAFYGIDPRGPVGYSLGNFPPPDLMQTGLGDMPRVLAAPVTRSWDPVLGSQQSMRMVAEATGGFAVTDTARFREGIARIVADFDHYYVLGFYPGHPDDHAYRRITVTSRRPDLTLRYRRTFRAGGPTPASRNADPMVALSETVLPQAALPLRLAAVPLPVDGKAVPVVLTLEVRAPDGMPFPLSDDLDVSVIAADLDAGKVAASFRRSRHIDLSPTDGAGSTYQVVTAVDLEPGRYQLRVSARSDALERAGSVYLNLDVPNPSSRAVELGGMVLGYADESRLPANAISLERGTLPFAPLLDRTLQSTDTLRVFVPIWRRAAEDALPARIELVDSRDRIVRVIEDRQPVGVRAGAFDVRLPLAGLGTGAYLLRASAGTAPAAAVREVGLVVLSGSVRFFDGSGR